jgi:hypothetical protein
MLSIHEHETVEEASSELLDFILKAQNWVMLETLREQPSARPGANASYQRRVGALRICASVDISPTLEVFLRVGFHAPGLTPMKAVDQLEKFLGARFPMVPNTEWQVEVDARKWIHFVRRYTPAALRA